jgi:hypothetical protein
VLSDQLSPYDDSYYVAQLWKKMPEHKKHIDYDPMKDNERLMQLLLIAIDETKHMLTTDFVEKIINCMKKNKEQSLFNMPETFKEVQHETILTYAIKKGVSVEIIEQFLKANPSLINTMNAEKETPLTLAEQLGQPDIVSFLLKSGAYQPKEDEHKKILHISPNDKVFQQPSLLSLFAIHAKKLSELKGKILSEKIVSSIKIGELKIILTGYQNGQHELNALIKNENGEVKKIVPPGGLSLSAEAISNLAKLPDDTSIEHALFKTREYLKFPRKKMLHTAIEKEKNKLAQEEDVSTSPKNNISMLRRGK